MNRAGSGGILPDGTIEFFKRRLSEAGGLGLMGLSLALIAALATFSPSDPSFNTATADSIQNVLGLFGAYTADILLQTFGVACLIPSIVCLAWGWKIMTHKPIHLFWMRFVLLAIAVFSISTALAAMPMPDMWPFGVGLGGVFGGLLMPKLVSLTQLIHPVFNDVGIGAFMMIIGIASFFTALNIAWSEWHAGMHGVTTGVQKGIQGSVQGISALSAISVIVPICHRIPLKIRLLRRSRASLKSRCAFFGHLKFLFPFSAVMALAGMNRFSASRRTLI